MFKIFIFITLLAFSIVFAKPTRVRTSNIEDWGEKCSLMHGVTTSEMMELFEKLKTDELDGVEERFMCYSECFLEHLEHKDEHGRIDFMAIAREKAQHILSIVEDCVAKYDLEQGKCVRSFKINACITLTEEERIQKERAEFMMILSKGVTFE